LKHFFNAKTYTSEDTILNRDYFFRRFTKS